MSAKVYTCKNCGFVFSRIGECEQCPDCGKYTVRFANEEEINEFEYRMKHPEESDNSYGSFIGSVVNDKDGEKTT